MRALWQHRSTPLSISFTVHVKYVQRGEWPYLLRRFLSHVNQYFNFEVQLEFTYITLSSGKRMLLVSSCIGTRYSTCDLMIKKDLNTAFDTFERYWLHIFGSPESVFGDDDNDNDFHRSMFKVFLQARAIQFKLHPFRGHNKLGIVERKNGMIKIILRTLALESSSFPLLNLLSTATF